MKANLNLGIYLGMLLVHGRVKKTDFNHVLDKAHRRLSGGKLKLLSWVVRLILIKSTLTALPTYTKTIMIPRYIIQRLDKLCQNFFWGSSDQQRKIHTLAWKKICRPKKHKGLGIPKLTDMNEALLAK